MSVQANVVPFAEYERIAASDPPGLAYVFVELVDPPSVDGGPRTTSLINGQAVKSKLALGSTPVVPVVEPDPVSDPPVVPDKGK